MYFNKCHVTCLLYKAITCFECTALIIFATFPAFTMIPSFEQAKEGKSPRAYRNSEATLKEAIVGVVPQMVVREDRHRHVFRGYLCVQIFCHVLS